MSYDMSPHNHKPDGGGPVQDGFWDDGNYAPSMGYGYSNLRVCLFVSSSLCRDAYKLLSRGEGLGTMTC